VPLSLPVEPISLLLHAIACPQHRMIAPLRTNLTVDLRMCLSPQHDTLRIAYHGIGNEKSPRRSLVHLAVRQVDLLVDDDAPAVNPSLDRARAHARGVTAEEHRRDRRIERSRHAAVSVSKAPLSHDSDGRSRESRR
jgi:hypothetical protein